MTDKEKNKKFLTHEAYFAQATPEALYLLELIQQCVESALPDVTRCISYNIPAFKAKRVFFYFAAFKHHIGVYPPVKNDNELIELLQPYRNEKGNLSFPLNKPLPMDLIQRVAITLFKEIT